MGYECITELLRCAMIHYCTLYRQRIQVQGDENEARVREEIVLLEFGKSLVK